MVMIRGGIKMCQFLIRPRIFIGEVGKLDYSQYTILNELSRGILIVNKEFEIIYANNMAEHIFHIKKEELVGQTLRNNQNQVSAKDTADKKLWLFSQLWRELSCLSEYLVSKTAILPSVNGVKNEFLNLKFILQNEVILIEGEINYLFEESQKNIVMELVQRSKDYMFFKDESLNYVFANQSYLNFLGLTEEQLLGLNDWDLVTKRILTEDLYYQCRCGDEETLSKGSYSGIEVFLGRAYRILKQKVDHGVLCVAKDVTEMIDATKLSEEDELTGMYNRRKFERVLSHAYKSKEDNFYLALIDLNGLRFINNTYGHAQGDNCLKLLAKALRNHSEGVFFRLEGNKFAGILDSNRYRIERLFLNILAELDKIDSYPEININIGVGLIDRRKSQAANYDKTEALLNKAKQMGQNKFIIEDTSQ